MTKVIWKYKVPYMSDSGNFFQKRTDFTVNMPDNATILLVDVQSNSINDVYFWAEVIPDRKNETRYFSVIGTGIERDTEEQLIYIGSFSTFAGHFVGHLYEKFRGNDGKPK